MGFGLCLSSLRMSNYKNKKFITFYRSLLQRTVSNPNSHSMCGHHHLWKHPVLPVVLLPRRPNSRNLHQQHYCNLPPRYWIGKFFPRQAFSSGFLVSSSLSNIQYWTNNHLQFPMYSCLTRLDQICSRKYLLCYHNWFWLMLLWWNLRSASVSW